MIAEHQGRNGRQVALVFKTQAELCEFRTFLMRSANALGETGRIDAEDYADALVQVMQPFSLDHES